MHNQLAILLVVLCLVGSIVIVWEDIIWRYRFQKYDLQLWIARHLPRRIQYMIVINAFPREPYDPLFEQAMNRAFPDYYGE